MKVACVWCLLLVLISIAICEKFMLVCYYPRYKYVPFVPPQMCTHMVFWYGVVKNNKIDIALHLNEKTFQAFVKLKENDTNLVQWIALGGSNDDYTSLTEKRGNRQQFIKSAVYFLQHHKLRGLVLDWYFPGQMQSEFTALLQELYTAMQREHFTLAVRVKGGLDALGDYQVAEIGKYVDFLILGTHDFTDYTKTTMSKSSIVDVDETIELWYTDNRVPRQKIILAISPAGKTWTVPRFTVNKYGAPIIGPGEKGAISKTPGMLFYPEICKLVTTKWWERVWNHTTRTPYAYSMSEMLSYENNISAIMKVDKIVEQRLAGAALIHLGQDDYTNTCGEGKYHITRTIQYALNIHTTTPPPTTEGPIPKETTTLSNLNGFNLFCYYGRFSHTKFTLERARPELIPPYICTYLIFNFGEIVDNNIYAAYEADMKIGNSIEKGLYYRMNKLKEVNKNLKTLLAVGGTNTPAIQFLRTVGNPSSRRTFALNVVRYLRTWNFDGFVLDWRYPNMEQRSLYTLWCKDIKYAINTEKRSGNVERLIFGVGVQRDKSAFVFYEFSKIGRWVDYIFLDSYDYIDRWNYRISPPRGIRTSAKAPLYRLDRTIHIWTERKISPKKIIVGLSSFGRSFTLTDADKNTIGSRISANGNAGKDSKQAGFLYYHEICHLSKHEQWTEEWDEDSKTPYAFKGDQWVSYDNIDSTTQKVDLVVKRGLGGVIIWSIMQDDFNSHCLQGPFPLTGIVHKKLFGQNYTVHKWYTPKKVNIYASTPSVKREDIDIQFGFQKKSASGNLISRHDLILILFHLAFQLKQL